jgi:hypothetical protein
MCITNPSHSANRQILTWKNPAAKKIIEMTVVASTKTYT